MRPADHHIHYLAPRQPTDTFCSCPHCGLIADHVLGRAYRLTTRAGPTAYVNRRCVDCGYPWTNAYPGDVTTLTGEIRLMDITIRTEPILPDPIEPIPMQPGTIRTTAPRRYQYPCGGN